MNENNILKHFKYLLIFSGLFNIIVACPFIFPVIFEKYLYLLNYFNDILNLGGIPITEIKNPIHSLLINTAGIGLVLIGFIILHASMDPVKNKRIILLNSIGRLLFVIILMYYILSQNIIRLVLFFGVMDFMISSGFIYYLWRIRKLITGK